MKISELIRVFWIGLYFISDSEQSNVDWTEVCCHGSLTFICASWDLDIDALDKRDELNHLPLFHFGSGKPKLVYNSTAGQNPDSYVYRDVDLKYEVILTKSTNSSGIYGQIISNNEDNNYVIEYCGTGKLHGIKKIAKSQEAADSGSVRDAGTKSEMLSTVISYNNTLQQKSNTRNKMTNRELELEWITIKFYYTKSFAKYTVDVNGFIEQVISSLNQAFINSHAHVRARATCTEEAPLNDNDPNLFRSFIHMKGTDSRLKDGAFAAQLLFHKKIPYSGDEIRSTEYCNQMDLQDRRISIVEKDCALGFLSSAHAIGHSLGLDDETFSDSISRANTQDSKIRSGIMMRRGRRDVNCYGTGQKRCKANGRRVRGSQIKIRFGSNHGRTLLRTNSYVGVSFCKLTLSEQVGIDTKELFISLREEILEVKDLINISNLAFGEKDTSLDKEITSLKNTNVALLAKTTSLDNKITLLKNTNVALLAKTTSLDNKITLLKTSKTAEDTKISNLQKAFDKEVAELKQDLNALKTVEELPNQCIFSVKRLTEKDRSVQYKSYMVNYESYNDKSHRFTYYSIKYMPSPSWSGEGWYRVEGEAGTRLAEKDQWPGYNECGTHYPGWMNAKHDDIGRYQTKQVDFCFGTNNFCISWLKRQGRITNCNGYFVYYLPETGAYERYCSVP